MFLFVSKPVQLLLFFLLPCYLCRSLFSCPCPCSQPQAWTNRKHLLLSAHSLCVLMSVRLKTEREQTLPSTPWSHCKHTYRSTRNGQSGRNRRTGRRSWRGWGAVRETPLRAGREVRSFSLPGGTHSPAVVLLVYNHRISDPWHIAGANQCGLNQRCPVHTSED